jgi:hypothetical protein
MKTVKSFFISIAAIMILLFTAANGYCQPSPAAVSDFKLGIMNVKMTSDKTLEFDLYLMDADPATAFELALIQVGIMVNPEIYNGGTLKASIAAGSSQLNESQQPLNILFAQDANIIKLPSRTLKPLAKDAPAGPRGSIISNKAPGTRICKIVLTNTVAFSKVPAKLSFNFSRTPYPTSISQYIAGVNTPITCNESNCVVKP